MQNRTFGVLTLLAVMGVSVVFGMILGGKLNAPNIVLAAPAAAELRLAPAATGAAGVTDFADIVERSIPAVVAVTASKLESRGRPTPQDHPFFGDPFFRRFFGPQEEEQEEGRPRPHPQIGQGSGFLISPDGFILTNYHVVEDSDSIQVTLEGGRGYKAEVRGKDPSIDLALLKIEPAGEPLPTLPLGDSEALRVGEWVIAIGNPLEFDQTVTVGVVSGKERRVPLRSTDIAVVSFIQTDAAINFGNSGGPLLDARGNVVGINTAINRQFLAEGIGFALPINQARAVVDQLLSRGFVRRGFLGITMNNGRLDEAAQEFYGLPDTNGVIISNVNEDGPGDRAGLKRGDVIRRVDGQPVSDNFDLVSKISSRQPGEQVALQVFRKPSGADSGRELAVTVTLADREQGMAEIGGADRRRQRGAEPEAETREAEGLGLTVESLTERLREQLGLRADQTGVLVTDVEFGSPAADKGLQPNLIITAINDQPVHDVPDWTRLLGRLSPGSSVKLDVFDGRQTSYVFLRAPEE